VEGDAGRRAVAEFVGTFALVFVGAGSIAAFALAQESSLVGVAFAHGLAIAVMASAVGHISGGHFNPAVTMGFFVTRRMDPFLAAVYLVTQFVAATVAALLLWWIFPDSVIDDVKLGAPVLQVGSGAGVVLEGILTFFLVWVIFATAADPRGAFASIAGLAIGLTITLDILIGGPLTGAAMNPARAFGPELVHHTWSDSWVWYVGPFVGGAAAALVYDWLYLRPARPVTVGPPETGVEEPGAGRAAQT
jgi:aquaporin Z